MRNAEIADALTELATLYELDGAIRYRVLAYREAARVIRQSPVSVEELARAGRATELPGVGKTLEQKILALLDTGEIPSAAKLKRKFPPSLVEVTRVPGVGAKTARRLYDELGVSSLDDLRAAAEQERIRELKGLGPKAEENVLASLGKLADRGPAERLLLSEVLPVAEQLAGRPSRPPGQRRGRGRRLRAAANRDLPRHRPDRHRQRAGGAGAGARSTIRWRRPRARPARAGPGSRPTTGSPSTCGSSPPTPTETCSSTSPGRPSTTSSCASAPSGWSSRSPSTGSPTPSTGEVARYATEAEVYERLGLAYIEPELREANGEIAARPPGTLPELVAAEDIRGDLHCHTTLSDGHNTLEEMAEAARARGYAYLAVTDHSASHGFGNHVPPERLRERIEEVRALNSGRRGFRLLAGSEVNILPDGSLDYEDDLLAELDWVIASVHTSFKISRRAMTERVLAAIEHPLVDCIGHLSGRLINRRDPYEIDVERVAEAAARTGTMLEINGNPNRRDLSERHARLAAEAGALICVNTDAHGSRPWTT